MENSIILLIALVLVVIVAYMSFKIVPQNEAHIVERLGKYHRTLKAGLNIIIPFVDTIAYNHSLKETVVNVPSQECITKDNITVGIDAILYIQVIDAKKASYGIDDYLMAASQLAQTTVRSEIGQLELERTFEERAELNMSVVEEVDKAAVTWGIKVLRFEVKDINPPASIKDAMEKKMRAEREKRAEIERSEGEKQATINRAEGEKQAVVAASEAEMTKRINEAQGEKEAIIAKAEADAEQILKVATATAEGIKTIAIAIKSEGGSDAVSMKLAEDYIKTYEKIAQESTTMILPNNISDVGSMVAGMTKVIDKIKS